MAINQNILISVATYNEGNLGRLRNTSPILQQANKDFKEFNRDFTANLGTTVQVTVPYRFVNVNALQFSNQALQQRVDTITIAQQYSVSFQVSDPQSILFFQKSTGTQE